MPLTVVCDDRPEAKIVEPKAMDRFRESETCKVGAVQELICSEHFKPDDFARRLDV